MVSPYVITHLTKLEVFISQGFWSHYHHLFAYWYQNNVNHVGNNHIFAFVRDNDRISSPNGDKQGTPTSTYFASLVE